MRSVVWLLVWHLVAGDLVQLTSENFDEKISSGDWIVKFYAPWCGHCQRMQPAYKAVAKELHGQVNFGEIDATKHQALAARFVVMGYPTLFFVRGTDVRKFTGSRTEENLKRYALQGWKKAASVNMLQSPFGFVGRVKGSVAKIGLWAGHAYRMGVDDYNIPWFIVSFIMVLLGMILVLLFMSILTFILTSKDKTD